MPVSASSVCKKRCLLVFYHKGRDRTRWSAGVEQHMPEMQEKIRAIRSYWNERGIPLNLQVRMGINTGYCTVGNFGSKERMDYTIMGGQVNIASRLTDDAKAGHILTDRLTYNRLRHDFLFEPPNVLNVKGKGEMTSYRLIGRVDGQSEAGKSNVYQLPSQGGAPAVA